MAILGIAMLRHPRHPWRGWGRGLLALASVLLASRPATAAEPAVSPEYQLKAVFLFNFTQFVEWPAAAFADAQAPLIVGVLGDDPFGSYLDETVRGEKAAGRPITIQRFRRVEEIKTCHILFIGRSETDRLEQVISALKGRSVLTVGDTEGFTQRGVQVRLVKEDNKIHLRINAEAAKAAGLTLSSKLLRLADLAAPGKD